jgi:hypothetical protein
MDVVRELKLKLMSRHWSGTRELVMYHMVVIFGFTKVTEFEIFFFSIGKGGGGVAKVFLCFGSSGLNGLYISPNLYTKVG